MRRGLSILYSLFLNLIEKIDWLRRDSRVHVAYLTTSSEGYSMMEQGFFKENRLILHLKQFLRRSFDVGTNNVQLEIREVNYFFRLLIAIKFNGVLSMKNNDNFFYENGNYFSSNVNTSWSTSANWQWRSERKRRLIRKTIRQATKRFYIDWSGGPFACLHKYF
jgi:hypothetical protein